MTTSVLSIAISGITPADQGAMAEAARRWDSIAKPIGGLGLLEEAVIRAAGVQGTADVSLDRKALAVFCADNGVTEEGVTQTGPEVTASVAASMAWGRPVSAAWPGPLEHRCSRWTSGSPTRGRRAACCAAT